MFGLKLNKKKELPKLNSSGIFWRKDKRKKILENSVNFMNNLAKEYDLENLPEELSTLINDLNFIYRNLYDYNLSNDKSKYESVIKKFPELKPKDSNNFDRSAYLINEKRKELLNNIKNIPKKNKRKGIIEYLNEKYAKEFEKVLKKYSENPEIEEIKEYLYNQSLKLNHTISNEEIDLIKKLIMFIRLEELPLISKLIEMNLTLDKFSKKKLNKETRNKINEIQKLIQILLIDKYEGYDYKNILENQLHALEKKDLKEFSKWYILEIKSNENLKHFFNSVKEKNLKKFKNIKTKNRLKDLLIFLSFIIIFTMSYKIYQDSKPYVSPYDFQKEVSLEKYSLSSDFIKVDQELYDHVIKSNKNSLKKNESMLNSLKRKKNFEHVIEQKITNDSINFLSKEIQRNKELISNPMDTIKVLVNIIDESKKLILNHLKSEDYLNKLSYELGSKEKALILQSTQINNLNTVFVYVTTEERISQLSNGDSFYFCGHRVYITLYKDFNLTKTTAIHELLHSVEMRNSAISEKAINTLKNSFDIEGLNQKLEEIGVSDERKIFLQNYYSRPNERWVRKKILDLDMERLGIKKYGEPFEKKHIEILKDFLEENKLLDCSKEFIETTDPEKLIEVMNEIAQNQNDFDEKNNYA